MSAIEWQTCYPVGTRAVYVGTLGRTRELVQVGKASRTGIRVKFLDGDAAGEWQTVHPDNLRPT